MNHAPSDILAPDTAGPRVSPAYRTYVLTLITLTGVLSYLDRQILGILLPQIKAEFALQDWQLGVLTGPAFSFIFIALTLPIAIIADRTSRKNVIALCTMLFSFMTMLCGYAGNFWQLCAARFGVGIGEAGTLPAGNSVLADLFPPEKRGRAMAVLASGVNIGLLIGYFAGGLVADHYGWRRAFLLAGGPGLLLGLLIFATVREPVRSQSAGSLKKGGASFIDTFRHMWSIPAYRWLVAGSALATWGLAGMFAFTPLFMVQEYEMSTSRVGLVLALYCGVLGALASYLAGHVADRLGKRGLSTTMLVPTATYGIMVPFILIFYLSANFEIGIVAGAIPLMLAVTYSAPAFAMAQNLAPTQMRAQSAAILITACYLLGSGVGPLVVGLTSDLLRPTVGANALPYALSLTAISNAATSICFWRAYRLLKASQPLLIVSSSESAAEA